MEQKDRETIQRMLGKIEGVAFITHGEVSQALLDALEVIDFILNKEEGAEK